MTVESTAARKPRRSAGTTAAKSGASTAGSKTAASRTAASKGTGAAGKKAPGTSGADPELVQLLTPEGERVADATYDPYVADITPEELRGLYRDMVLSRRFDAEATSAAPGRAGSVGLDARPGGRPDRFGPCHP